jgi:uncharacterized protein with NRDE domain
MSTILLASRHYPDASLAGAVNYNGITDPDHPETFGVWENRYPTGLGPLCKGTGATWMGLNEFGVFAAITNRYGGYPNKALRTRGQLVFRALAGQTAEEALARVMQINAGEFNPFHLAIADLDSAMAVWSDGAQLHRVDLGKGLHIITERSFGAGNDRRELLMKSLAARSESVVDLADAMAVHRQESFDAPCVHLPDSAFGTQSSCIFEFHQRRGLGVMYAPGPPCACEYEDFSAQVNGLMVIPRKPLC